MQKKSSEIKCKFSLKTATNEYFNIFKRLNAKLLISVLAMVMLISSFGFVTKYYTIAYDVYYGDVNVGTTTSKEEAVEVYNEAETAVEMCNRSSFEHDLTFVMTVMPVNSIADTDMYRAIVRAAEGEENCFAIVANGEIVVKLKTREEVTEALDIYLASFEREDAVFHTNFAILPKAGIVTELSSVEEAVEIIKKSGEMIVTYEDIHEDNIVIEHKTVTIEDENIPKGLSVCYQEGEDGVAQNKTIYYEDGIAMKFKGPLTQTVKDAVDEIIHVGTGDFAGLELKSIPWPAEGRYTSDFGPRWGRRHNGIDIAAKKGTDIFAPAPGVVTFADTRSGYGNYVTIDHGNGYVTTYAHMNKIMVSEGDVVNTGMLIGEIGTTGRVTGSHLHFEILYNGEFVDPIDYIAIDKELVD